MKTCRFIILLIVLTFAKVHAQQLRFVNVSNDLKIPSPVCYNVFRDYQGYIWICTDAGLCRYNGTSLKIFDGKNGLPEASIYEVTESPNHVMWFATSKNRILNYVNDSLQEATFSKKYVEIANNDYAIPFKISFAPKGYLYINTKGESYQIDILKNKILQVPPPDTLFFLFKKIGDQIVPIKSPRVFEGNLIKLGVEYENKTLLIDIPRNEITSVHWRVESISTKDYDFIGIHNHLIRIDKNYNYTITTYPSRILSLMVDSKNGLWLGAYKDGLYYYPDINNFSKPIHSLSQQSISGITEDYEGGIWASSLEKGIFFCYNKSIIDYSNIPGLDKYIDILKNEGGKIYTSSNGDKLFEIGDEVITHVLNTEIITNIYDMQKADKGWLMSTHPAIMRMDDNFKQYKIIRQSINNAPVSAYQLALNENKQEFAAGYGSLVEINGLLSTYKIFPFKMPAKKIMYKGNDVFYIGTDKGLYELDRNKFSLKKIKGNTQITQLYRGKYGIWATSKGEGLYLITDSAIREVSKPLRIPSDFFYDVTEDKYGNIWAGSNIGLIKIYNKNGIYKYKVYNMLDGLASNNVYNVAANDSQIFIGTTEGLVSFPLVGKMNNHTRPKIYLKKIFVNDVPIKNNNLNLDLEYNKNSLRLVFDIISYRNFNHKTLFYKLKGKQIKSQKVQGNEIILDNIQPDEYTLEVFALNDDAVYSKNPIVFNIIIRKPFWETAWFIVLAVLIFCFALFYSVKKAIDRIKTREEAKTKINKMMAEYQLTALQAQMNPHFIFNAINSIQSYILQKNEEQAYDYLAKFSKLIRMVLHNSEEKILSLHQELETLDLYIQLEQLRFENKFEYKLEIADNVKPHEISMPAMLIQPYVENAIWHGIMNLHDARKGILSIKISIHNDELKIVVEDNGVGREFSQKEKKRRNHLSMGMKLSEKRLDMLNKIQEFENARVNVLDLFDSNGNANGTRVEIYIPIK